VQKTKLFWSRAWVLFSFFRSNRLVVNFAPLKLKIFVPSKSSGMCGVSVGGCSPRGFTVSGFVPKERKKERRREIGSCEKIRFRPGVPVSLVWHGVVSISLHS